MENIQFYEIENKYVDYLVPYAPHLFHNRQKGQANERKNAVALYKHKLTNEDKTS